MCSSISSRGGATRPTPRTIRLCRWAWWCRRRWSPRCQRFISRATTASRATIGGMVGNNSCGGRSLRFGTTRDNVISIDAVLADGASMHFGEVSADLVGLNDAPGRRLAEKLLAIGAREADEVAARFPSVQRRVGGYNIDALDPRPGKGNLAHILVGSGGTLAHLTAKIGRAACWEKG